MFRKATFLCLSGLLRVTADLASLRGVVVHAPVGELVIVAGEFLPLNAIAPNVEIDEDADYDDSADDTVCGEQRECQQGMG